MDISVVVATYNQKERLKLVLEGLRTQTVSCEQFETVVVDDGSTDGTHEVVQEYEGCNFKQVHLSSNMGRCIARNTGIARAEGELIVFLDGDALPHPQLLEAYWEAYKSCGPGCYFHGHHHVLPQLEYFQDPQTGKIGEFPRLERDFSDYITKHCSEMVVTTKMIHTNFAEIEERALDGGYPTTGNAEMQRNLIQLLEVCPSTSVSWVGFTPHNAAVPSAGLQSCGLFDEHIPFSEGIELAFRLRQNGMRAVHVGGAKSFHLYHYHDFSNPKQALVRNEAVLYLAKKYTNPRMMLIPFLYSYFWPDSLLPERAVIRGYLAFEEMFTSITYERLREYIRMYARLLNKKESDIDRPYALFSHDEGSKIASTNY